MTASRGSRLVPLILGAIVVVAALVFHRQVIAWFSGAPMGGSSSPASSVTAGGLTIATSIEPDPPREAGNVAHVQVHDAQGKAIEGAKVRLDYDMPAMGAMQAMHGGVEGKDVGDGRYDLPFDLPMAGSWTITISVTSGTATASARYTLRVGSSGLTALDGSGSGSDVDYYTCSMHPHVHSETPGTCPICGMNLTPVTKEQEQAGTIHIDEARRAVLGIRTTKVAQKSVDLPIVAKGRLAVDETRLHEVTLKIGGYVSDLRVNATGQTVARGDTLFTLYSPELYAAEQEYLIARANRDAMHDAARGDALVHAAETKLRLWGLSAAQLQVIADKGEPIEKTPFASPASGVVMQKNVVDGAAVTAGQKLFEIADLEEIWVEADVYEADLPRITKGMAATVALSYLPGQTFAGKVSFVYPYLDPTSRTGRVRVALPNKGLALKPDMFATVTFAVALGNQLVVPSSAVVYTGPRRLVFVDLGGGALRPQEVTVGATIGDDVVIASGLHDGDVVVSSGNFLVAAESRVRSASAYWEDTDAKR